MTLSAEERVERALARADEVDGMVASVCTRNDAALDQARERDAETREGGAPAGPCTAGPCW